MTRLSHDKATGSGYTNAICQRSFGIFVHPACPQGAGCSHSLISISTPAGRSRLISASTVLGLGLLMSIRRLWVRRSNCSRLSLYLWTARRMVTTSFLVGRGMGPETVRRFSWRSPQSSLRSGRSADGHRPSVESGSFHSVPCCCFPPKTYEVSLSLPRSTYGGESDVTEPCVGHAISMKKTGILRRLFPLLSWCDIRQCSRFPSRPIHGRAPRAVTGFHRDLPHHRRTAHHSGAHGIILRISPSVNHFFSAFCKNFVQNRPAPHAVKGQLVYSLGSMVS